MASRGLTLTAGIQYSILGVTHFAGYLHDDITGVAASGSLDSGIAPDWFVGAGTWGYILIPWVNIKGNQIYSNSSSPDVSDLTIAEGSNTYSTASGAAWTAVSGTDAYSVTVTSGSNYIFDIFATSDETKATTLAGTAVPAESSTPSHLACVANSLPCSGVLSNALTNTIT